MIQIPPGATRAHNLGEIGDRVPMSDTVELLMLHHHVGQPDSVVVVKWANSQERALYEFVLTEGDAPRLLGSVKAPESPWWWLLLEALDQDFPDLTDSEQVKLIYRRVGLFHVRYAVGGGRTLVHRDLHRWNMVWHDRSLRFIDWAQSGYGNPVEDLALLEPERDAPPSDILPTGRMAELALQAYQRSGPLDCLSWSELVHQQRLIRLLRAAQIARQHESTALTLPDGEVREVVLSHARRAWQQVKLLRGPCQLT